MATPPALASRTMLPGVEDADAGSIEVPDIPRRYRRAHGTGDRRDLTIDLGDRAARIAALRGDACAGARGFTAKRQHAVLEQLPEGAIGSFEEPPAALPPRKEGDARSNLCLRH